MLYFDRIDLFEGIDVNKISDSKQSDVCRCFFLNKGFKSQPNICNECHDLLMMFMNLTDITILNIKNADYRCIISRISKQN